jgi:hypothetical protein
MCPIPCLTKPVRQGIVEGRVFLSILVNEWYLMPECWLSLGLVKSIPFLAFEPFAIQLLSVNQELNSEWLSISLSISAIVISQMK